MQNRNTYKGSENGCSYYCILKITDVIGVNVENEMMNTWNTRMPFPPKCLYLPLNYITLVIFCNLIKTGKNRSLNGKEFKVSNV
jgi:hypothetical protein